MFVIRSEKELLESFRELDREAVEPPEGIQYPIFVKDYLAWSRTASPKVFLLFSHPGKHLPVGIAFRGAQSDGGTAAMCEWCHSVRSGGNVRLLTAQASSRRSIGLHLCRDLSCKDKVLAESPGADDVPSSASGHERVRRVLNRISEFAQQTLF